MADENKVFKLPLLSRWLSNYTRLSVGDSLLSPQFTRRFMQDYKDKGPMAHLPSIDFLEDEVREIDNSTYTKYAFSVINLGRRIRYHVYDLIEEWHPEVSVVLDTIADEICIRGLNNQIFDVIIEKADGSEPTEAENAEMAGIKTILDTFYFKTIDVSKRSWEWARNMVKYGDWFVEPVLGTRGIIDLKPFFDFYNIIKVELPTGFSYYIYNRESEEATQAAMGMSRDYPSSLIWQPAVVQTYASNIQTGKALVYYDGEIIHFKLSGKPVYQPYGTSHLDSIRNTWEMLKRMEDAVMIYRMVRAPERKIFYVATGKLPPGKAIEQVNRIKNSMKRKPINSTIMGFGVDTGDFTSIDDLDKRFRFIGIDEDYWIPVPSGGEATKIDTLPGASNLGDIEDLSYFRTKMYAGLRVPKAYLAQEEDINRATLSQQDVRFARLVQRFQESLSEGIEKLGVMQLYAYFTGMDNSPASITKVKKFMDSYTIQLRWTAASFIEENARYEGMKLRAEAAETMKATFGETAKKYIAREIFRLTPEEEELLLTGEEPETETTESAAPEFGEMPGMGGEEEIGAGLDLGGGGGEEAGGAAAPEAGGAEAGGAAAGGAGPAAESIKYKKSVIMDVNYSLSPIHMPGHQMSEVDKRKYLKFLAAKFENGSPVKNGLLKDHAINLVEIGKDRSDLIKMVADSLPKVLELSATEYSNRREQTAQDDEESMPEPPSE